MEKKEFKLTDTKNIKFNFFKGNLYYHINDTKKSKSITFSQDEMLTLPKKINKIIGIASKTHMEADMKKKQVRKQEILSSSESSDSESSSSSSICHENLRKKIKK